MYERNDSIWLKVQSLYILPVHLIPARQPGFYASLLHITPKALGRITEQYFNKTLTGLISERTIIEAKRNLYLTSKPVKTIAYNLGFDDEFYFSRYFKNHTNVSPQLYRDTVGAGVAETI
jgi:AraC-like DNA-binding protein